MSNNTSINVTNVDTEITLKVISKEQAKLIPADGATNDQFGHSVAISSDGNTAIVGAIWDDDKGTDSGSVYVYSYSNGKWLQEAKLVPADGSAFDEFGISVAISADGNTAIIGSVYSVDDKGIETGSAYIYTRNNGVWSEQTKLIPVNGNANDLFGISVAISADGNTAIIGASGDDDNGTDSGSAYIYVCNDNVWSYQDKLVPADGSAGDNFGFSVAISGDGNTVIVGARGDNDKGTNSGSAYIYSRNNNVWIEQAKLVLPDGAAGDHFGFSVAINYNGNTAIIGAIWNNDRGINSGSAYIYSRNSDVWSQQAKLVPPDGAADDNFGWSVAISADGNTTIIGAYCDDDKGINSGSAYIYSRNNDVWIHQTKLVPADGAAYDGFGVSVAISANGNKAIIGAYWNNNNGIDSGSAYIFV